MKKIDSHVFMGMQRDTSISKQRPEFLWEAHNIRLTARDEDTLLSLTNERGPKKISDVSLTGEYLGHCVINDYLVVFTLGSGGVGYIYRITKSGDSSFVSEELYHGALGFGTPIEALGVYENELVQKVYWVDGVNQPRVINITKDKLLNTTVASVRASYTPSSFDFVRELALGETVHVTRQSSSGGQFQAGVIQYALTYYDKYGQETNIVYVTPLHYIAFANRGGSPEEKVGVSFKIDLSGLDTHFDYARIYSIYRSSLNGTPVVKRLTDIPVSADFEVSDGRNIPWYNSNSITTTSSSFLIKPGVNNTASFKNRANESIVLAAFFDLCKDAYTGSFTNHTTVDTVNNTYYHFKRSDFPYIELHVDDKIITWGDATDMWVYPGALPGAWDSSKPGVHGNGKSLVIGTSVSAGNAISGAFFIDNGTSGEIIDPTSLLYIGGEDVTASTIAQKDGTLFLGNLKIRRPPVNGVNSNSITPVSGTAGSSTRNVTLSNSTASYYNYKSLVTAKSGGYSVNPSGFKREDKYRFGIQLQYKTGKWSDPIFLKDDIITTYPTLSGSTLSIPTYSLQVDLTGVPEGYKRVRGVVVFPSLADRLVVAQGIVCPTVFNLSARKGGMPYAQSSWFFRPVAPLEDTTNDGANALLGSIVEYRNGYLLHSHGDRGAEIQGMPEIKMGSSYKNVGLSGTSVIIPLYDSLTGNYSISWQDATSLFAVDRTIVTFHSPDIEFDEAIDSLDFSTLSAKIVGRVEFDSAMGDISIQTSSPTVHPDGAGFVHRALKVSTGSGNYNGERALVAGLFYSDYLVDDSSDEASADIEAYSKQKFDYLFMVYPWHKSGSLNNDAVRRPDKGTRTAVLSHKKLSNLRFASDTTLLGTSSISSLGVNDMQLFSSDQVTMVKLGSSGDSYYGNIDTVIAPAKAFSVVFDNGGYHSACPSAGAASFTASKYRMLYMTRDSGEEGRMWHRENNSSNDLYTVVSDGGDIGDGQGVLATSKEAIRMKYKSTKHVVLKLGGALPDSTNGLQVVELRRADDGTIFGGNTAEAKESNIWIPAGEPITINRSGNTTVEYIYGDTWYQRYDCLKTYPFTLEDENSVTEIASFLVETRMNIDGRYDKNRGQLSNLVTTPTNFNLLNPVYTQPNNFFSYRILDSDYYKLSNYQSSVAWSLNKQSASTVDSWTKVTLANVLDCDGSMGAVTALATVGDTLYCFQEEGVSQILFNSRVQIPASDGVPIEISNNYKVDGNRYISNCIGCRNKWSIALADRGLYFVGSNDKGLYYLSNNNLSSVSGTHGFSKWFKDNISDISWSLDSYTCKTFYDKIHNDVYVVDGSESLNFSEILGQFVSFHSYGGTPAMFNVGQGFYSLRNETVSSTKVVSLWEMFAGYYNVFFGRYAPFDITFISNADSTLDKTFTNLELRADFYMDVDYHPRPGVTVRIPELQHRTLFDYIRVWNEYQDSYNSSLDFKYYEPSNLKKKFRIWRIDIPRATPTERIRNTWTYITLGSKLYLTPEEEATEAVANRKMVLHDASVVYHT